VPFLVSGISSTRARRSRRSQRIAAISPRRMVVSVAQVMRELISPAVGKGCGQEARLLVAHNALVTGIGHPAGSWPVRQDCRKRGRSRIP
jgi:hypothetical protein